MSFNNINMIDVQNRAKSLGLKLNMTSNLFADFDLNKMDRVQQWVWTGEGVHPHASNSANSAKQAAPVASRERRLMNDLLDLQSFLNDFDNILRTA